MVNGLEPIELYTLTITVSPEKSGTTSPSTGKFEAGTKVKVEATPSDGFKFDYWSGSSSDTTTTTVVLIDKDKEITANFKAIVLTPAKEAVIKKVFPDDSTEPRFLSAQEYDSMTNDEKAVMSEVLTEKGKDSIEYERKMKSLFPKKVVMKPTVWRHK